MKTEDHLKTMKETLLFTNTLLNTLTVKRIIGVNTLMSDCYGFKAKNYVSDPIQ